MMPVPITPDMQIIRSTKNTWSSFFHTPSVEFFESSNLKKQMIEISFKFIIQKVAVEKVNLLNGYH